MKKVTTTVLKKMKRENEKISMLTAYDCPTAKIMDDAEVDVILVGDSLGMVVLGYNDTIKVTVEDIIHHTSAVSRGAKRCMIVADMPFLSYHQGKYNSVKNAGRLIQEGNANAVKLEGGVEIIEDIKAIINAGIPVMGHLGLTPQSVNKIGGYYIQGKSVEEAEKIIADAVALEKAGVFSIVLECVPCELSKAITDRLSIPTIGIGAGKCCDGQVLVTNDLLGSYQGHIPKFVKQYENIGEKTKNAVEEYIKEVKNGQFPEECHEFHSKELEKIE